MRDEELRALERQILAEPTSLDLRRRHAQLLLRLGDDERALGAIDLAWRLGADELRDELRTRLDARRLQVGQITLCWVPGGPFAMGADDLDEDAKPLHLVHLAGFYVGREVLTFGALQPWLAETGQQRRWWSDAGFLERWTPHAWPLPHEGAVEACRSLDRFAPVPGREGHWQLITEAQWERVFRAAHLERDGLSPYGVVPFDGQFDDAKPEWTADGYLPNAYGTGPRRDPFVAATQPGSRLAIRGAPGLEAPHFALYRDAAKPDGTFELRDRSVRHNAGIVARPVFVPAPRP